MSDTILNYHLMHPGGDSSPGDPNAAFHLDGVYHLHYILAHPWKEGKSFSFVHVTSPDMLHWTWQPTKLQPSFTGHGMYSGTGFMTKEGHPAIIYHGQGSDRNYIAVAQDRNLSAWDKPYPVAVHAQDGSVAKIEKFWDPDCFRVGDTYYAISGGLQQPLFKSTDLHNWTLIGEFLKHDPGAMVGEDISCPNFFPLGNKWMLLCISHSLGCRYYLGNWDAEREQFEPEVHGRMNWRREGQPVYGLGRRTDFFAPESVLTPGGRRVMWAWLNSADADAPLGKRTIQALPRELYLSDNSSLRISPLRELDTLRYDPTTLRNVTLSAPVTGFRDPVPPQTAHARQRIAEIDGEAYEIRIVISREEALRKLFGFLLFSDRNDGGLPVMLRPETGTLRVGTTEAPFDLADLPADEDIELRIFVDKYLVEVFANGRQAMLAAYMDYAGKRGFDAFTVGAPTTIKRIDFWRLKSTNQGLLEARVNHIWECDSR